METTERRGERVRRNTALEINRQIDRNITDNLERYAADPNAIESRIRELDREWDIERTLEMNAAGFALTGTLLGMLVNKRWLILPVVVTTFLAQHALQGWCPPLVLFRKMGIRTRPEIDREKYALKGLRGDFASVHDADSAWNAVN
jgi:hypothetical protein